MDRTIELIAGITDREFDGQSFNGPPLLETLRSLTLDQAGYSGTIEGYTVWGIVLHLAYWKWWLAAELMGQDKAESPFPYQQTDWPSVTQRISQESWDRALEVLVAAHGSYMKALRGFAPERLEEELTSWHCTYGQAIGWMTTHDTYHVAQIRNMGLKNLQTQTG